MKNTIALVRTRISALFGDTRGANMVEYMILTGVVALGAIIAFTAFKGAVNGKVAQEGAAVSAITTN